VKELDDRIARAAGARPVAYERCAGGYSTADRFVVALDDGRSVFVKSAEVENLAGWLRREHEVYASLSGSFIPGLVGWDDDGVRPLLAIDDLSGADWSVRSDPARVDCVVTALAELAACAPPPNTLPVRETHADLWERWRTVAADPEPFLATGLRDAEWLERSLPTILAAAESAPVEGDGVCHLDVRSDNICFVGDRAVLVDWNWVSLANPAVDLASWLPSVRVEGGPPPWELLRDGGALAAFVAGVWAAVAGLPPPETAPTVRAVQRAQLAVALDWVDRDLL
jgi:Phosphotransferase enzyme family